MKPACPSMALVPSSFSIAMHSSSSSIPSPCRWLCHALPIVQPTKFDLIINRVARQLKDQALQTSPRPASIEKELHCRTQAPLLFGRRLTSHQKSQHARNADH